MPKGLTVRAIETIKPAATRQEIADGFVRGLYFVIQPSGAKSWAVRYRTLQRVARKYTLGSYPGIGLKDARELASRALVSIASGGDPAATKQAARAGAKKAPDLDLIEKVVDSFVERYAKANTRASTAAETDRVLKKEVVGRWAGRRLTSITRADVHEMLDEVVDRGSPILANRLLAVFRKMCGWAIDRGLIETSPCDRVKAPSVAQTRNRVLADDELARIWKACDKLSYPFGPLTQLLALTGQRRDEVGGMRWSELDLEARLWTLPRDRAKNGVEHSIPLSPQAVAIIKALPRIGKSNAFLFTTNARAAVSGFSKTKVALDKTIVKDDGDPLPHWTFHDLRRTAATGMARLGVGLPIVEKVLNHVSGSFRGVAGVYNRHSFDTEKRHALESWAAFVERLVTGEPGGNVVTLKAGRS